MASGTRQVRSWTVACLLCLGFWQLGQGAYIPAKAWLAQELMQRAWMRAGTGSDKPVPWPWADTWNCPASSNQPACTTTPEKVTNKTAAKIMEADRKRYIR